VTQQVPLVGRGGDLAVLASLIDAVGGGARQALVLEGEAGIGKTRLVVEAIRLAEGREVCVLRGGADELAGDRPFGPLMEALASACGASRERSWRAVIDDLARTSSDVGAQSGAFAAVDALVDEVERLASEHPLLLVVEVCIPVIADGCSG
jgi:predicted ATPase